MLFPQKEQKPNQLLQASILLCLLSNVKCEVLDEAILKPVKHQVTCSGYAASTFFVFLLSS